MKFNKNFKERIEKKKKVKNKSKKIRLIDKFRINLSSLVKFIIGHILTIFVIYVVIRFITAIGVNLMAIATSNIIAKGIQNTNQAIVDTQSLNYLTLGMSILTTMQYFKIYKKINNLFSKLGKKLSKFFKKKNVVIGNEK